MRITNNMMISTLRRNINRNLTNMEKLQNQLSTGKRISKPSDDPIGVNYSLRLRNNLTENNQYVKNADDGLGLLGATDSALNESGQVLQRLRELTVQAANGTNDANALEAIRKEVHDLRSHLLTITNTQFSGKYIFSGTKTDTATFDAAELWQGNNTAVDYEIGVGVKVPVNIIADNVFKDPGLPGAPNVFQDLATLEADLTAGNFAGIGSGITQMDKWLDNVNSARAEVGARVNRLDFVKTRLEDISLNFHDLLSKTEDADIAQVITNLKMQENVYRASLSAGARIIQPSLIDFLR